MRSKFFGKIMNYEAKALGCTAIDPEKITLARISMLAANYGAVFFGSCIIVMVIVTIVRVLLEK